MQRFIVPVVAAISAGLLTLACLGQGGSDPAPAGGASAPTTGPASVTVCGLLVTAPGYGKDNDAINPLGSFEPGVRVALLVKVAAGQLVGFVDSDSKLARLADDKGTNLAEGEGRFGPGGFAMGEQISKDHRAAMVELRGTRVPSSAATGIVIEGTLAFRYSPSGKRETVKLADVALKAGTKLKAGPIELEIASAGKPQWGDEEGLEVEFKSSQDLSGLAGVRFLDAQGKVIESSLNSRGRVSFSGITQYSQGHLLKKKVDKATVVLEYWPDIQTLKLPMNLKAGVGL